MREVMGVVRIRFIRPRPWLDRQAGVYRKKGVEIEVSEARAAVIIAAGVAVVVSRPAPPAQPSDDLDAMTVAELKALAAERGIDLGDARRKADIIQLLRGG